MAMMSAIQCNPTFKATYHRLVAAGKPKNELNIRIWHHSHLLVYADSTVLMKILYVKNTYNSYFINI